MLLFDSRHPFDVRAPLEEPSDMDLNIGGELIQKGPYWAAEINHRPYTMEDEMFCLPKKLVSSLVFKGSFPFVQKYYLLLLQGQQLGSIILCTVM